MLNFRFFSAITLVFLCGCASSTQTPTTLKDFAPTIKTSKAQNSSKNGTSASSIDPDVMFMILAAEIAGQRGRYDVALEGYMEAAKRVNDPRFAERATVIAMYIKDSKKTSDAVSLWLKQDPENLTARKVGALAALRAGDKKAAVKHLDALLGSDPASFENLTLELADVLHKEKKIKILYDTLESLSARHPESSAIYFVQSVLAMQLDKTEQASQKIKAALKLQPDWDKALVFQAQIAIAANDMTLAKSQLKNASLKYPKNEKISRMYAQLLIKGEDYNEAGKVYQRIVSADPSDTESRFALGLIYLQLDKDDQARALFSELLKQEQWKNQASFYLGKLEEKNGNTKKALEWLDKGGEDGPIAFEASIAAVNILARSKQYDEAITRLAILKNRFPKENLRILLAQAELHSQQKHYDQAFKLLTEALEEQPAQKELLYTRALIAERMGKTDILESDLKKILDVDPNNSEALNALGYTLLDNPSRYKEAETHLTKALHLRPDEAVIMDSYGWLQFKLGNAPKALEYLNRAYAKQPENEIVAHIAEVLWSLGKKDEAKKLFNKALKNAPDDEYLLDFKARILNKP